jgi:hypothetical protein
MNKNLILRSQANEVFRAIQQEGLNPSDFGWSEILSNQPPELVVSQPTHSATGFYFKFDFDRGSHHATFSPGDGSTTSSVYPAAWGGQLHWCTQWLRQLHRELEEPDLWSSVTEEKQLVASASSDLENTPFSLEEQQKISLAIAEIRIFLLDTNRFAGPQVQFIEARLKHLEEASRRLGRKDWITLAIGALTNIIVGVALAPDAARELLRMAGGLLGWISSGFPSLP